MRVGTKVMLFAMLAVQATVSGAPAQVVSGTPITVETRPGPRLQMTEVRRIGSMSGPNDDFGRIMSVDISRSGKVLVADDLNHRVAVFGPEGEFIRNLGRRGKGPGEFESPWLVATDAQDSVFVWDVGLARITVFRPDLSYARDFRVPPHWLINGLDFLPDGRMIIAAYGRGERGVLHVLSREGTVERTFGPIPASRDLAGYESSLLGGNLAMAGRTIAYSSKSPYEILFFDIDGQQLGRCVGQKDWTTRPEDVVTIREDGAGLNFGRFIHSSRIISLGDGLFLNTIHDPVNERRILDVMSRDCTIHRRQVLDVPLSIQTRRGTRLAAVRNLEYPELIIYESQIVR